MFEGVLANNLFKISIIDDSVLLKDYLFYVLKSEVAQDYIQKQMYGLAMPALNFDTVGNFSVPVPSIEEQHQIIKQIEEEKKIVDECKRMIKIQEQKIKDRIDLLWETDNHEK